MLVSGGKAWTRFSVFMTTATVLPAIAAVGAPPEVLDASMAMAAAQASPSLSVVFGIVSLTLAMLFCRGFGGGVGSGKWKEIW